MAHGMSIRTESVAENQGVFLFGVIVNAFFTGIVTKQQYLYWTGGYKDPIYVRALVVAQCFIVLFQIPILWFATWNILYVPSWLLKLYPSMLSVVLASMLKVMSPWGRHGDQ
ncbi:hypothetical protein BGW80DRAFT_1343289 [Lactifluus volemus]|nr:hypothetical protein BGW80DRAFT_1343289 [Lactifluus volemus]